MLESLQHRCKDTRMAQAKKAQQNVRPPRIPRPGFVERPRADGNPSFSPPLGRDELIQRAYYLEARLGFPSDRALADALGVHRSQVSRWSQGKLAQRENAWLLRDVATAVSRLADHYETATIEKWLFA